MVDQNVPRAIESEMKGMERFRGSARRKLRRRLEHASYIKLKDKRPLKISSVKRVQ